MKSSVISKNSTISLFVDKECQRLCTRLDYFWNSQTSQTSLWLMTCLDKYLSTGWPDSACMLSTPGILLSFSGSTWSPSSSAVKKGSTRYFIYLHTKYLIKYEPDFVKAEWRWKDFSLKKKGGGEEVRWRGSLTYYCHWSSSHMEVEPSHEPHSPSAVGNVATAKATTLSLSQP